MHVNRIGVIESIIFSFVFKARFFIFTYFVFSGSLLFFIDRDSIEIIAIRYIDSIDLSSD